MPGQDEAGLEIHAHLVDLVVEIFILCGLNYLAGVAVNLVCPARL